VGATDRTPHGFRAWGYCVVLFFHMERPHQGLGNKIIAPEFENVNTAGAVICRKRLGGLLKYYYREAA
jgi:hypothetical protein